MNSPSQSDVSPMEMFVFVIIICIFVFSALRARADVELPAASVTRGPPPANSSCCNQREIMLDG